jgi:hypothetical protein
MLYCYKQLSGQNKKTDGNSGGLELSKDFQNIRELTRWPTQLLLIESLTHRHHIIMPI